MPSVVLLSLSVIWVVPALLAVTVTRFPEKVTVATLVLDELALRLPETLDKVMTEVVPDARLKVLGLALIAGGVAVTVVGMPSVVLLSLSVIWTDPALLAVTVTSVPEIATEATRELDELARNLPETLDNVMMEVAPDTRLKVLGLALIAGVGTVTVTGMERLVARSLTLIRAVPPALAVTMIFPLDSFMDATLVLLELACGLPDTLLRMIVAVVFLTSVNDVREAVMAVFLLLLLVSKFPFSAKAGCDTNSIGVSITASQ